MLDCGPGRSSAMRISSQIASRDVVERLTRKWKAEKENLQRLPPTKCARRFKKTKVVGIEEAVYRCIVQKREASRAVMVKDIKAEALRFKCPLPSFMERPWIKLELKLCILIRQGTKNRILPLSSP
ncbi:hypothetical protein RB195_006113 [Necator americanus]|uniref:Uncharacterized protein n=1 Tax=Necator americanus TaxID=51031 RepID=A0ABR1BUN8_NECAM